MKADVLTQPYLPEGNLLHTPENEAALRSAEALAHAAATGTILEAVALVCDKDDMSLHFDLGGTPAVMAREEVADVPLGTAVKDIAVLTRVGRAVSFLILRFEQNYDGNGGVRAHLSRRLAQRRAAEYYRRNLRVGDLLRARVTHLEPFGAFADVGCGLVALLSVDCISVSRISHAKERLSLGEQIPVVVKSFDRENMRLSITHRELLGTWEENAAAFSPGQTVIGTVRSMEDYGVFVELTPNLAGLAEYREGIAVGQNAAVYIKSISPERMKIKLSLVDSYVGERIARPLRYFISPETTQHLDRWRYSPSCCARVVETVFCDACDIP